MICPAAASGLVLSGPGKTVATEKKRVAADIVLDGVHLSERSYPLLYQEFTLRSQRFLQDFELNVTLNGRNYSLHAADIDLSANTLDLFSRLMFSGDENKQGNTYSSEYTYDKDKAEAIANNIMDELNATLPPYIDYSPTFNIQTRTFTGKSAPSQLIGYDLDPASFASQIYDKIDEAVSNTSDYTASLDIEAGPIYSRANPNTAAGFGLLGVYSTQTTNVPNRNTNIRLAAQALNGCRLRPGATFSFNRTLGYTSADRGFKEAGVLVNGKPETDLGGGICQVSSTLYNAALAAGMGIVERHSHSAPVGYVPPDRDATVSYGGPDFRFRNNTPNVSYLVFQYDNRTLTVSIYGKH